MLTADVRLHGEQISTQETDWQCNMTIRFVLCGCSNHCNLILLEPLGKLQHKHYSFNDRVMRMIATRRVNTFKDQPIPRPTFLHVNTANNTIVIGLNVSHN